MYVLARMVDTVRIQPFQFEKDGSIMKTLEKELNYKFSNKVVIDVGLCVCFYDFEKIEDSLLIPGDGATQTKVHFRFIVFRPQIEEVIIAKVKSCDESGVRLSVGFFDDIFVPQDRMQQPSHFQNNQWVWTYQEGDEEGEGEGHKMIMEVGYEVKFRVSEEEFRDLNPSTGKKKVETGGEVQAQEKAPYSIINSKDEALAFMHLQIQEQQDELRSCQEELAAAYQKIHFESARRHRLQLERDHLQAELDAERKLGCTSATSGPGQKAGAEAGKFNEPADPPKKEGEKTRKKSHHGGRRNKKKMFANSNRSL